MIPFDSEWSNVDALVKEAIHELKRDEMLFRLHANERSITHRLAVYLEKPFDGWNVDCEYSRIGEDPSNCKRLLLPTTENASRFDMNGSRVYPRASASKLSGVNLARVCHPSSADRGSARGGLVLDGVQACRRQRRLWEWHCILKV